MTVPTINQNRNIHEKKAIKEAEPNCGTCKPFCEWPEILTIADIIVCCAISARHANEIMKDGRLQRMFPNDRRSMVVGRYALRDFINGRVIQEDAS